MHQGRRPDDPGPEGVPDGLVAEADAENRQLAGSLGTILKGGGSVNNVADVFDSSGAGRLRLAQLEDQIRMQQIENLKRSREYMVDQEDKAFMYNVDSPWKDKAQANAAAREQATKGIWNGLQTVGAGVMNYAQGREAANMMNDYFSPIGLPSTRTGSVSGAMLSSVPPPARNLPSSGPGYSGQVPFRPAIQPRPLTPYALPPLNFNLQYQGQ